MYKCHVPSCGPLSESSVIDSLKKAYDFYKNEFEYDVMPVICNSWLLYPQHYELFPESSNLRRFYELFDIIHASDNTGTHAFWRIFNMEYNCDSGEWPETTRLQKRFKKYLMEGNKMGEGTGIILFDGNRIVRE